MIFIIVMMGIAIGWGAQMLTGRRLNWIEALIAATLGSLLGGLAASLLLGEGLELRWSGPIGAFLGAVLVLWAWGAIRRRA